MRNSCNWVDGTAHHSVRYPQEPKWASCPARVPRGDVRVLADPRVHRDGARGTRVDGAGGAVLRDGEHSVGRLPHLIRQPDTLLAKDQHARLWQVVSFERNGAREVVDSQDRELLGARPGDELFDG